MAALSGGSWIARSKLQPRLRLFCFPYAGGGASIFRLWSNNLPAEVEVCPLYLPGRENRLREPLFTNLSFLVQTLAYVLHPYMDIPFAFFGHSMGALIGFELTRYLRRSQLPGPVQLFMSACQAPQLPDRSAPLHQLSDTALIDKLHRLGGTPKVVLEHQELMRVMLPILRADLMLYETYIYTAEPPLGCPISVFGGEQDTFVNSRELRAWKEQTNTSFTFHMFPGDHFFLTSQQSLLLQMMSQELIHVIV